MEEQRFDELTKADARSVSRRQVLKLAIVTAAGGLPGGLRHIA